jgi:acyl-CoA synthetase (AMP-forming)/AMP-acid ligase II/thioesterase domain-containing protein/acyl carrier protein
MPAAQAQGLRHAIAELAATQGEVAAILAPGRAPLTFARLHARVEEIRATLNSFGIGCGDRVAAALPAGPETAVCFFAVASCATYAPLNPEYAEDEFDRYFARLRPVAVIVPADAGTAVRNSATRSRIRIIELVGMDSAAGEFELRCSVASGCAEPRWGTSEDLALILLTSGMTDQPKVVPMKHRHLIAHSRASRSHFGISRDDRYLHVMPMFHGHGIKSGLVLPMLAGSGVICAPRLDAASIFMSMATMGATWYSAGYALQRTLCDRISDFQNVARSVKLRFSVSSSGPVDVRVIERLEAAFGAPVLNRYSSSETCLLTCEPLPPRTRKRGTAGIPVLNEIRVVDANGAALGAGEEGEIVARGPGVMDGYLDDPEANLRAFVDGWFRTGDAGCFDEDGYLTITGRIKDLINRGGEKIAPSEVERVLGDHPAVDRICVFGIAHPTLGEEVAAAVVPAQATLADERSIIDFAYARLANFKVPRRVIFTPELPMLATGKIDRRALSRAYAESSAAAPSAAQSEASPLRFADEVAALWQRLLGVETIPHHADFFLSGGDSLKITELLVAIQQRFGVRTSMRELLQEGATVAGIARLIARAPTEARCFDPLPRGIMALKVDGDRPPLFAVPGSDGNAGSYVHFCQWLDERWPLYGLLSRGLDGTSEPLDRMAEIAVDHIEHIRALQPCGPYFLIGACFGGRVAYEIARQLEAAGERVAFLAMLDPSPPLTDSTGRPRGEAAVRGNEHRRLRLARFIAERIRMYADELRYLDGPSRRAFVKAKLKMVREIILRRDLFRGDRRELNARAVYAANHMAGQSYVPAPYCGAATIVFTAGRVHVDGHNHRLDWLDLLPQCNSPRYVPGRDTGDMLIPPNVYALAASVNEWLEDAHSATQSGADVPSVSADDTRPRPLRVSVG